MYSVSHLDKIEIHITNNFKMVKQVSDEVLTYLKPFILKQRWWYKLTLGPGEINLENTITLFPLSFAQHAVWFPNNNKTLLVSVIINSNQQMNFNVPTHTGVRLGSKFHKSVG